MTQSVFLRSHWKASKSIDWDLQQGTGTVRSAVRPPQESPVREKRSEVRYSSHLSRKALDKEKEMAPSSICAFDEQNSENLSLKDEELINKRLEMSSEDVISLAVYSSYFSSAFKLTNVSCL